MKFLLIAVNAKYIHSNPAIYTLKAYAGDAEGSVELAEYTINQDWQAVLRDIYRREPDAVGFSCYIWNITYIEQLAENLARIRPELPIWLGGPEVSYRSKQYLEMHPEIFGIMCGEGEVTFREVLHWHLDRQSRQSLADISGITWRDGAQIHSNPCRVPMDLSQVPFVYESVEEFEHRIIYYESSRGCPFRCSYCLSSVDKRLRFRDLELVKKELQIFLDKKVPQVKFVDRTFNCNAGHSRTIWNYLREHDNGITNFHFEIAAHLLEEEDFLLLQQLRPGQVQLEIGVQTTNPRTAEAIHRAASLKAIACATERIRAGGNIHQHLDLIAGLPFEDYESFGTSFNDVYRWKPDQLQLGFLKVLSGTQMEQDAEQYGIICSSKPPYEVLRTNWLSFSEVCRLKNIEEVNEIYYNSGQFLLTLRYLETQFDSAFAMFEALGDFLEAQGAFSVKQNRIGWYEWMLRFLEQRDPEHSGLHRELLTYDAYLRERLKSSPSFLPEVLLNKNEEKAFFIREKREGRYLQGYEAYDSKQMQHMTWIGRFHWSLYQYEKTGRLEETGCVCLFDYLHRDWKTQNACVIPIEEGLER